MRFYDEARAARKIERKAFFLTLLILFFMMGGIAITITDKPAELIPDSLKELIWEDDQKEGPKKQKPKQKA